MILIVLKSGARINSYIVILISNLAWRVWNDFLRDIVWYYYNLIFLAILNSQKSSFEFQNCYIISVTRKSHSI